MIARMRLLSLSILLGASTLAAQFPPLIPFEHTLDLLIVDSSADGVWRCKDLNQDGDYNDAGEITSFYDDAVGSIVLTNPDCVAIAPNGVAYIADSSTDEVLWLEDKNADGDANDPGEHGVFFSSAGNAGQLVMASVQGMTIDALGNMFLAVANAGSAGKDMILRLKDGNGDGDAQDAGEAQEYCVIPNASASVGDSIPTNVRIGPDARLYYTEVGATGAITKGVYRLEDKNNDGDCNDAGEWQLFWQPTTVGNPFYWAFAIAKDGTFYVTDHGNEKIYAGRDADNDGTITGTEGRVYHSATSATWWEIFARDDGKLIVCEDQTPDRLLALEDLNQDGDADDAGERLEIYSDLVSSVSLRPRAGAAMRAPSMSVSPAAARLGNTVTLNFTTSRRNEPILALFAFSPANIPSAPFGLLGLDPNTLQLLLPLTAGADATAKTSIKLPLNTNLVRTWPLQAVAGDPNRPFLTNTVMLTITR